MNDIDFNISYINSRKLNLILYFGTDELLLYFTFSIPLILFIILGNLSIFANSVSRGRKCAL